MAEKKEILGESHGYSLMKVTKVEGNPEVTTVTFELHGKNGLIKSFSNEDEAVEAFIKAVEALDPQAAVAVSKKLKR